MIAPFAAHTGAHVAAAAPLLPSLPQIFRRFLGRWRRKPAVPAALASAGTATAHPATDPGMPLLRNRTLSEVRAEAARQHAAAMNAGYVSAVDRLRQEAGLPTVQQMREMRAGSPPWLFPPLEEPLWEEPQPRGPVHDTRMDVYAPHYAPDAGALVYGQAPQLVVEPELARRVIA
jgi:hypothetical protein